MTNITTYTACPTLQPNLFWQVEYLTGGTTNRKSYTVLTRFTSLEAAEACARDIRRGGRDARAVTGK